MQGFLVTISQVLILFIFIAIGYVLGAMKLLDDNSCIGITNLILYVAVPATLISSFQFEFDSANLIVFFKVAAITLLIHIIAIIMGTFFIIEGSIERRRILKFAIVFPNCSFMGYPLMTMLLGSIGIFFGSAYVVVSIIIVWSYGIYMISGNSKSISMKTLFINPGIIGALIATILYLTQTHLPDIILSPIKNMAALNTPLPMIIIGYQLLKSNLKSFFISKVFWVSAILRLIILPFLSLVLLLYLKLPYPASMAILICTATPPATMASLFALKYDNAPDYSSGIVTAQTALSVITLPIVLSIGKIILI